MESYAARQAKLWKVLSKCDHLPDHFHDLKTTLQTKFNLLKKATSKNIENLQEAIQSQQAYTTTLCGHVNSIYTKLAQLDTDHPYTKTLNNQGQSTQVTTDPNWKTSQN